MKIAVLRLALLTAAATITGFGAGPGAFVCPQAGGAAVGSDYTSNVAGSGTCNVVITVSATGVANIATANPNPYDGNAPNGDDNLVGVVNNSLSTITILHVSSTNQIFALDNDGICSFTPFVSNSQPCNAAAPGAENYAGTAISFTNINAGLTSGDVSFTGIAPGGTGYFSLEQAPGVITVSFPVGLTKAFNPSTVVAPGSSTLSFTLTNPNAAAATSIAFTDTFPAGVALAATPNLVSNCAALALTTSSGGLSASVPSLGAGASCTFSVSVVAPTAGTFNNVTGSITSTGLPTGPPATATLVASVPAPTFTKTFTPAIVAPGGSTTLTFSIRNNDGVAVTGLAFTDALPAGVVVATPNGSTNSCGGTLTAAPGSGSVSLTGGTVNTGASSPCVITVNVIGTTEGIKVNTTGTLTSSNAPTAPGATATLTVISPALISKSFGEVAVVPNGSVALTFNISNPNTVLTLTGVGVTDNFPAGLLVSNPSGAATSCTGGTVTAVPGSGVVMLAGASLAPGTSCTLTVFTTAGSTELGTLTNISGPVVSNAGPGGTATATIFVGDPFQVTYIPNLNLGDSFVNITNTGARDAANQSGTGANITGALCANVYTFAPDEQLVSCCSCPVTPNGLVSLSAKSDLVSNTLTPTVESSIVVKLLATVPVGGTCNNSAAAVSAETLSQGLIAFGTKLHAIAGAGTGADGGTSITETPFTPSALSAGELNRLGSLCTFIINTGSGFGICRSCRLGGLGASLM